jgi:hypothetical protein
MADRQVAQGKDFGLIIPFNDGERMICKVVEIRATTGEYDGFLVDCLTPGGEAFSINGHKVLIDKIQEYFQDAPMWFDIIRDGKVGRAINYHVAWLKGSDEDILLDKSEKKLIASSEKLVEDALKAMPAADEPAQKLPF